MTQELLLHIGLHKTGMSHIQRMFANNLPAFQAAGESDLIVDDGIKYQMSPEARRDFLRPFQEGNRRVAERCGLGAEVAESLASDQLHSVA